MNGAFYIGATGLGVQQRNLDAIAQNVANINTTAYKRTEIRFAELLSQPEAADQVDQVVLMQQTNLAGVRIAQAARDFAQGDLRETGSVLDLAISGDGFLEVLGPAGQAYLWRGGALKIDEDRILGTADGLAFRSLVQIPEGASVVRIERDGRVRVQAAGDGGLTEIGRLDIVMPDSVDRLSAQDGGYYLVDDGTKLRTFGPGEDGKGVLVQGSLEASNTDLSTELVGLLLAQRAFGANAQVVQAGDQLMGIANGLRR